MKQSLAALSVLLAIGPVWSQDTPKTVKTLSFREHAPGTTMFSVNTDGDVRVDWSAVEKLASEKIDRTNLPIAQLMLAIRDGHWKPMDAAPR